MKIWKNLLILLCLFSTSVLYCTDYNLIKIQEYPNTLTNEGFFVRPESEIGTYDDASYLLLKITEEGKIYVFQFEQKTIYLLDSKTFEIEKAYNYDLPFLAGLLDVGNDYFRFSWDFFSDMKIDIESGEVLYKYGNNGFVIKDSYYDEECDVLFFRDSKSNLYSIEHPSMDEAKNKANFKGSTETIEMLNSGKYAPHLTTYRGKLLAIDGNYYYWEGKLINGKRYQNFSSYQINFYPTTTLEGMIEFDFRSPDEQIESITIHPCGDIYVLRMNWNTNTHILYRVENTWDPEWRASWYAEHPDAPGQELPSGNGAQAAASKVRTGYLNDDRIRLRKGPGTGTDSLGTYPINTTFTILENSGVKQTIDGVTDEWIKVRLNDGTEGYFYGQYVSEKKEY